MDIYQLSAACNQSFRAKALLQQAWQVRLSHCSHMPIKGIVVMKSRGVATLESIKEACERGGGQEVCIVRLSWSRCDPISHGLGWSLARHSNKLLHIGPAVQT